MINRPLLTVEKIDDTPRSKQRKPIPHPHIPTLQQQVRRFSTRFDRLSQLLSRPDATLQLQSDAMGLAPDRALVFEIIGSISEFGKIASQIGFEFLGAADESYEPDENFYFIDSKTGGKEEKPISGTMYLAMPSLKAMQDLCALWSNYKKGRHFQKGQAQWKTLFDNLKDIRPWGVKDRLTEGFLSDLELWIECDHTKPFLFEINIWHSTSPVKQTLAFNEVKKRVEDIEGRIVCEFRLPEILYHGILVELTSKSITYLTDIAKKPLAQLDAIMHLSPKAMTAFQINESSGTIDLPPDNVSTESPICAMIDGFPLANHSVLAGKLSIDDFLGIEEYCLPNDRVHGTAMASLILNGDLNDKTENPIKSKLLSIPILQGHNHGGQRVEEIPSNKLIVDIIYTAVKRLKEGDIDIPATGKNVIIINHSLGDIKSPYASQISAWGKLIDYLSFKYNILFVVSAGNHTEKLEFHSTSFIDFGNLSEDERKEKYFEALALDMRNRGLLAPTEAINAMTVGAWHADCCNMPAPQHLVDILPNQNGPSPISALGLGFKRTIKPDLLYDGGRTLSRLTPDGTCCALKHVTQPTKFCGQQVASPTSGGDNGTINLCGTSNAAALITRKAVQLNEMLDELGAANPDSSVPIEFRPVITKALLAHGCSWSDDLNKLDTIIEPIAARQHSARRTNISRLLGYGRPDISRVFSCTAQRATIMCWDTIKVDRCHKLLVPLPHSLSALKEIRRITTTLAWFSPVNPLHQQYRQAVLEIKVAEDECGVERKTKLQPPHTTTSRGTLVHQIFEGDKAVFFNDYLSVDIICRQQAGDLRCEVPYGFIVSFEVGTDAQVDIYKEISEALIKPRETIAP